MEYKVEELSPVKRKVAVEVSVEEVHAALAATVALYRKGADIKGFRKGKVPSSVVEAKYRKQIYGEATTDLINYHINDILGELKLSPLSRIDVDAKEMERDENFSYSFSFEIAPSFDLPEYKGLAVEEEDVVVDPQQVEDVIERIRQNMAKTMIIKEERPAATGDIAVIDFQAFQDGAAMEGIAANKFELPLGEGNSLPEFEDIVIGMTPGETKENALTFPADFINDKLAGQTVSMQVTLHAIKARNLPEVDADFAEQAGGYSSVQDLKDAIEKSYVSTRKQLVKGDAQKKLLDGIKAEISFELPQSIVEEQIDKQIVELQGKLERQGKSLDSLGRTPAELREENRAQAEDVVKSSLVLLAIASAENLTVDPQEVDLVLQKMAASTGQDFHSIKDYYEQHNLMIPLKDRVLADKAMELIYENATVTTVPPAVAPNA
ncbi:trigger factor [Desulfomicrobium sp. ZS1]|jgi:trigger factor|uniref:trigger factor n=1 Tax=Desulfomicrobium sp. ZS1 TaxID=2952228 RepID=UPI0020B19B86|nr:trigger factor [Desulfomicrobium sp. ZS1]UTF49274.1 trigger factor [Desulfomicrobium sp. ZS1]